MANPSQLAFKYCKGRGVELGAAIHNAFNLNECPNIAPSDGKQGLFEKDLEDYKHYEAEQKKYSSQIAAVDYIGDFQNIPITSNSLDYVISSHVIEHEPNPIAGLLESSRTLKDYGIFFCIFPKRNAEKTRDIFRSVTKLEQLIQCYNEKFTVHSNPENWRGHYHVYSLQSMLELINWINKRQLANFLIEAIEETDSKVGNGHTIVLRKLPQGTLETIPEISDIENSINNQNYLQALINSKLRLSVNFFEPEILYAAGILSVENGDTLEGREFLRQALIQNPESEHYRGEFFRIFNEYYENPLL